MNGLVVCSKIANNEGGKSLCTLVLAKRTSFPGTPHKFSVYRQMTFIQHRDINRLMEKLIKKMVECRVTSRHSKREITRIFIEKLEEAELRQQMLGNKAVWRDVEFDANNIVLPNV